MLVKPIFIHYCEVNCETIQYFKCITRVRSIGITHLINVATILAYKDSYSIRIPVPQYTSNESA